MIKKILPFLILFLFPLIGEAQLVRMFRSSTAPTGTCQFTSLTQNTTDSHFYFCDDGVWVRLADVSGTVAFKVQNNIRYADQFAGANAGAKIQAAHDDLPSTGGTIDARGFEGAQAFTSTLVIAKQITLLLGCATFTMTGGTNELIRIEKSVIIKGGGFDCTIFSVGSAVGATVDAIRIAPNATQINGLTLTDFTIQAQSGTPGRYPLHIDLTNAAEGGLNDAVFDHLQLLSLGGNIGIYLTNPTVVNGFYTSTIRDSVIANGMKLNRAGDTLRIINNTFCDVYCGSAVSSLGIDAEFVIGASDLIVEGNNMTTRAGHIKIGVGAVAVQIVHNELETPTGATGSNGASIDIDGGTAVNPANVTVIRDNTIQIVNAAEIDGIRINHARSTYIHGNRMPRAANSNSIVVTANASNTDIGWNYYGSGTTVAQAVSNSGTGTTAQYWAPVSGVAAIGSAYGAGHYLQWVDHNGVPRHVVQMNAANGGTYFFGYNAGAFLEGVDGANYFYHGGALFDLTSRVGRLFEGKVGLGAQSVFRQPNSALDVTGNVEVVSPTTLGTESLTNGALTSGTSWTQTGDMALSADAATYTHSIGSGTLTQASGTLAIAGIAGALYSFTYTISAVSGTAPACTITTAFASSATALTTNANATYTAYFYSAAAPADLVVSCTSSATGAFT